MSQRHPWTDGGRAETKNRILVSQIIDRMNEREQRLIQRNAKRAASVTEGHIIAREHPVTQGCLDFNDPQPARKRPETYCMDADDCPMFNGDWE